MVDAADSELVRAIMELHLAEVADYAICECIDCGQAEALKEEVERRERARLEAAKKRLRELMEARGPRATKTIYEKGVPVGLVGIHALVNIVPGMLKIRPSLRDEPEFLPDVWMEALELANYALMGLIPFIPEPREEADHD